MPDPIKQNAEPKMVRVDLEKEPPKEVLEQTFSIDPNIEFGNQSQATVEIADKSGDKIGEVKTDKVAVDDNGNGQPTVSKIIKAPIEKKEEAPKAEPKEEKKEEKPLIAGLKPPVSKETKKVDDGKEVIKKITLPESKQRDLSGFNQSEQAVLKQMSNEAFTYTTNLIKENKELAKLKDTSFLQHPQAYVLSPEYQQTQAEASFALKEAQYWQQQLETIKQGKPFKPLVEWDKNGNPVLGAEIQPTDAIEEDVRLAMSKCYQVATEKQQQLRTIPQQFKGRVDQDLQAIQQERQQRFAWVSDPKLLDYTINIDGVGDVSLRQVKEDFRNLFPPYLRSNPGVEVASDLFIALRIQAAELAEAKSGQQTAEIKQAEVSRAEPGSSNRPLPEPKPEVGNVREFSLAGLPQN